MDVQEEKTHWRLSHVFLILAGILILGLAYGVISQDLYSYLVYRFGFPLSISAGFQLEYLVQFVIMILLVGIAALASGAGAADLGLRGAKGKEFLIWGLGGGIALFLLVMLGGALISLLVPELPPQPFEEALRGTTDPGEILGLAITGSMLAPLSEELYFRAIAYPAFKGRLGVKWGIVISGIFFGLLHWDWLRLIPLALGGMGLAYIYQRTRSIYVPWMAHGVWNAIMIAVVYLS